MRSDVSIIVPVYNCERYLSRCLDSVINQSFEKIEIVIINDGSTDKSGKIALEYAKNDARIRYYEQQNRGVGATRNLGIEKSMADYITFVDSDDTVERDFIENIYFGMLNARADIGICDICYVDSVNLKKKISKIRGFHDGVEETNANKSIVNKSRTFACGKIYKKFLFKNIKFPNFIFEDVCTIPIVAALASRIVCIHKPLYSYFRNNKNSLSENGDKAKDMIKSVVELYERFQRLGMYDEFALEYKKIIIGQIRFACHRFPAEDFSEIIHFAEKVIPELAGFTKKRYYVDKENDLLCEALEKCIPEIKLITHNKSESDCFIDWKSSNISTDKPLILLNKPDEDCGESTVFDLAEEIMEKVGFSK